MVYLVDGFVHAYFFFFGKYLTMGLCRYLVDSEYEK